MILVVPCLNRAPSAACFKRLMVLDTVRYGHKINSFAVFSTSSSFSLLLDEFGVIQVDEKVLENVLDRSIVDVAVGLELANLTSKQQKKP